MGAQDVERTLIDFEGGPEEGWSVTGTYKMERTPSFVKSGTQALRITFTSKEKWPGLRLPSDTLKGLSAKALRVDIHNPQAEPVTLALRVDDAKSKNVETELHARRANLSQAGMTSRSTCLS